MSTFEKAKASLEYNLAIQPKLAEILEPLQLLGISNFSYGRITKDQKFFRIGNHEDYTNLFYKLELFDHPLCARGLATASTFEQEKQTKVFIWNEQENVLSTLRKSVSIWNGANIYITNQDCMEAWSFGGSMDDIHLTNFIINNMDILNRFFRYFKEKAEDLIDTTDRSKTFDIAFHDPVTVSTQENQNIINEFLKHISTNRYHLSSGGQDFVLTLREVECLMYKNQGKTAKEIARILNISYRTVETYLDNIKIKSGLSNVNQVLAICRDEGLV